MTEVCIHCKRTIDPGELCILHMNTEVSAAGQAIPIIAATTDGYVMPELPEETLLVVFCSDECVRDHYMDKCQKG